MIFGPQQEQAIRAVKQWLDRKEKPVFRLFGYAGTGKTTLARHIGEQRRSTLYAAYTGKAAMVMNSKGCTDATTLHRLIYKIETDDEGNHSFKKKDNDTYRNVDLFIIDECSMVDEKMAKELLSFKVPILVLGDPAQLPPIKGQGYFTDHEPDFLLTEVHRQARESGIVRIADAVRKGIQPIHPEMNGDLTVVRRCDVTSEMALKSDQIIVGTRRVRAMMNHRIRQLHGFVGDLLGPNFVPPQQGERLICLRNGMDGLINGGMWNVVETLASKRSAAGPAIEIHVQSLDDLELHLAVTVLQKCFVGSIEDIDWHIRQKFAEFDFGYAITCHKAQGSQWDDVLVFFDPYCFRDQWQRWLYTAITRASHSLTLAI